MTGSVSIRRRRLGNGELRYDVRFRRGGRGFNPEHGGTFDSMKLAKLRKAVILGELAAGRDPRILLTPVIERPSRTGEEWAAAWLESRVDLSASSINGLAQPLRRFNAFFGKRDLHAQSYADVQEWVGLNADLKPTVVRKYLGAVKQIFDFAGVEPNPARDARVKTPRVEKEEVVPPTGKQVLALLDRLARPQLLATVTIEQTGMAAGEIETLAWGDVDVAGCQFRLKRANVKGQIKSRARWVQLPQWLMAIIADSCPLEDRSAERRVFPRSSRDNLRTAMWRACRDAEIANFSPHDLRHRRLSLWHGQGVPARELAARAGHSRASMTLDVYSHVMPDDEIAVGELEARLV